MLVEAIGCCCCYVAATESHILVLTIQFPAPADLGVTAAAFVAVGRIDIAVALVDKMAIKAAVSFEFSNGVGSAGG